MTLRVPDLFSGIGGFAVAGELVGGFETVQFVEIDAYCQKVLAKHWPNVPIHADITDFQGNLGSADVVVGGFPCQDISSAGKGAGIKEGTRSGLFYELMRVVRDVRPQYVVLENVAAIRSRGLDTVLGELAAAGFDAEWACIRASDVGACHRRERLWIVGERRPQAVAGHASDGAASSAHSGSLHLEGRWSERQRQQSPPSPAQRALWLHKGKLLRRNWRSYLSQPVLRRGDDGLRDRTHRLKALGNSVVPQVAMVPLARVLELHAAHTQTISAYF